jgi:exodeoxyribonuclease-3
MRIATWNVNSIKARLPNVLEWLGAQKPDVLLLQEIKCETHAFPALEFEALGYKVHALGQKTYNGVAILSRSKIENVREHLPEAENDPQARYLEATVNGVRVASIYLPNGNPVPSSVIPGRAAGANPESIQSRDSDDVSHAARGRAPMDSRLRGNDEFSEKYLYKLVWMRRLSAHMKTLWEDEIPVVLGGDYNVIPEAIDVFDPKGWEEDALYHPRTKAMWREMMSGGYTEAFRALNPEKKHAYTFWDYQAGAWQRDAGLRIDHFLLSPEAADRLKGCFVDRTPRGKDKASDHTPVVVELANS